MPLTIHFDGLCLPRNPGGVATYGFVAKRGAKILHEEGGLAAPPYSPRATNNVAEYTGVLKALEWARAQGFEKEKILVRGDSELVIRQLKGEYKVKSPSIVDLFTRVRELAAGFSSISFEWIPREQNGEADALTNRAYAEFGARGQGDRRREDGAARVTRGFSIEVETPADPTASFRALKESAAELGEIGASHPPDRLGLKHDDGGDALVTLTSLRDGTRIRVDYTRPAGENDADAIRAAERAWHAALLALQSRLEP